MKRILKSIAIDASALALIILILVSFSAVMQSLADSVFLPASILDIGEEELMGLADGVKSYFFTMIITTAIASLMIMFILSIAQPVVWRIQQGKKIDKKYIKKSLYFGMPWYLSAAIISFIIFMTAREPFNVYILGSFMIIFTYLSVVIYHRFSKKGKLELSILKYHKLSIIALFILLFSIYAVFTIVLNGILSSIESHVVFYVVWSVGMIAYILFFALSRHLFIKRG